MDAEGIRELFADILPVRVRRLFGGLGVYDGEMIFALVFKGDIYLKTSPATLERFIAAGCRPFTYEARGRERALGYWSLPDAALDDLDTLRIWTDLARDAARQKASRLKPRGSRLRAPLR
jgi:DNA transformation protein